MQDGFVKVAACSPAIRVAHVEHNANACVEAIEAAVESGAKVVALPELCLTGATCQDLLWQRALIGNVEYAIGHIAVRTALCDALLLVGAPIEFNQRLYDCMVVLCHGRILGIVPKRALSAAEKRYFSVGPAEPTLVTYAGSTSVPFGAKQAFWHEDMPNLCVAVEFFSELCSVRPPSAEHALAGATVVVCPSAAPALVGSTQQSLSAILCQSERLCCAYLLANAGTGESTTDYVFCGQQAIVEKGSLLCGSEPFADHMTLTEVDVDRLVAERRRAVAFQEPYDADGYIRTAFDLAIEQTTITRRVPSEPFIPRDELARARRCEEILNIQAHALAQRMQAIGSKQAVIGISGGLDSTLALLVTARAFDLLGIDRAGITAITMPGFGTTDRTHNNAWQLTLSLGATPREIPIGSAVRQHFADIGHDENVHNAAYENAQARERTQILMDVANDNGGIVVGTGDLSELALGWATYNGDHMSMYAVNAAIPKTLIRHIVRHVANTCDNDQEAHILLDVLDTPVSPELLPANADGSIAQQTEDLVGPYELHDFFIYYLLRHGFAPRKVYRLARIAFAGAYDDATILKWLKVCYRRFFSQQFKRSCSPDGPAVGAVGLSPRGGLLMPSDASSALWLDELEEL